MYKTENEKGSDFEKKVTLCDIRCLIICHSVSDNHLKMSAELYAKNFCLKTLKNIQGLSGKGLH